MEDFEFQDFNRQEALPQQKKKRSGKIGLAALILIAAILGGIGGSGLMFYLSGHMQQFAEATHIQTGQREEIVIEHVPTGQQMTAAQVYAQNVDATVGITTAITTNFWGYQTTSAASGSGFILTEDGYILTNYHVIQDSSSITVSLYDGSSYDAKLIGYDASNDIAVIKVEEKSLPTVVVGTTKNMHVGDTVVAIGNPLGELTFSLTQGVISAMDRKVTLSSGSTMNLLQTDCTINSGNSGGALFNLYGEVIGITNAKYSNNGAAEASIESIGFAIPIEDAMLIVESIIEKGYVTKPYLGVSVTDVSLETQNYGLPEGAAIQAVAEDSPAETAGLLRNDIIVSVNDAAITGSEDLVELVRNAAPGDQWTLQVYRKGEYLTISLQIGEQVQSALPQQNSTPNS